MIGVVLQDELKVINGANICKTNILFAEWSRETLLEKWMKDPMQCCQLAGVQIPNSAGQQCGIDPSTLQVSVEDKNKPHIDQDGDIVVSNYMIISVKTHFKSTLQVPKNTLKTTLY